MSFDLRSYGIDGPTVLRNATPARLYEDALRFEGGSAISDSGALIARSGSRTGRSPKDKRICRHPSVEDEVWWGSVNQPIDPATLEALEARAREVLASVPRLYVVDGFAGWDPEYRVRVRIICERAYHALFMRNMLIRPDAAELDSFGEPDYVIYNAGSHPAPAGLPDVDPPTSISLCLERGVMVIFGTEYAGEMKKGVFTIMNHIMPRRGVLSMHCSANAGAYGDVSIFFGLSGTGKTTLSADPDRRLIGDDEHCWTHRGVFNIEGGCYAKAIDLSPKAEPEIFGAIRFGAVLENVAHDAETGAVDFSDRTITENTRCAYPLEHMPQVRKPCMGDHPRNIIFLTCDAFGVLPPVSRLTPAQAMYYFISGYTAKLAGTEVGVNEPQATFSACFGAPFLVWHPARYAEMLAERIERHNVRVWLVNTGWAGGPPGIGRRMRLGYTRALIDAIHDSTLERLPTTTDPVFGLAMPVMCPGVPGELLVPARAWSDPGAWEEAARNLADLFAANFAQYSDQASPEVFAAGPQLAQDRRKTTA